MLLEALVASACAEVAASRSSYETRSKVVSAPSGILLIIIIIIIFTIIIMILIRVMIVVVNIFMIILIIIQMHSARLLEIKLQGLQARGLRLGALTSVAMVLWFGPGAEYTEARRITPIILRLYCVRKDIPRNPALPTKAQILKAVKMLSCRIAGQGRFHAAPYDSVPNPTTEARPPVGP